MRRKTILIIAVVVLVVIGAVFGVLNIHAPGKLSIWQKIEVEHAYQKQFQADWGLWEDETDELLYSHARYYGSENGYLILCKVSNTTWGAGFQQVVGKYKFIHEGGVHFQLFVYKDGTLLQLKDAYEQGLVSEESVVAAWTLHREYPGCKSLKK